MDGPIVRDQVCTTYTYTVIAGNYICSYINFTAASSSNISLYASNLAGVLSLAPPASIELNGWNYLE